MSALAPIRRARWANATSMRFLQPPGIRYYHESAKKKAAPVAISKAVGESLHHLPPQTWLAPKPQLNIHEKAYEPSYYDAISKIMKIRQKYVEDRGVFVEGREITPLLKALGATDEDFDRLQTVSDNLVSDPTLPYRKTRNGRFCIDFDSNTVRRLEFQPFALSLEEDFKRHDSGKVRIFEEVQNELQLNTAFQALLVFKIMVLHGMETKHRPKLDYETNKWVCTLFSVRTTTTPDILGEPALEGVHSDGVDHTMTTYLGSTNMAPNSAVTYMHDMAEQTGIRFHETRGEYIMGRVQHRTFMDTLIVADHERKHSLSPVWAIDSTKPATRDMLVFFTRKPVTKGHISEPFDSLRPHKEMPMEIPLFVPNKK